MIENLTDARWSTMMDRNVAGTVIWKSGRPLEDAYLACIQVTNTFVVSRSMRTERSKSFLYGDLPTAIEARDYIDEIEGRLNA